MLKVDVDGNGTATWQEFGHQLRESPTLSADTTTVGQIALSWTAVVTTHWSPAPTVTYTVLRDDTTLAEGLSTTTYTDTNVTSGRAYTYQVIALVDGRAGRRSAQLAVTAVANQPPAFDDGSSTTRSIAENTTTGVAIGDPVAATDLDDTSLHYSLSGTDPAAFDLNTSTGQLQTKADVTYDHETKPRYTVTVRVRDGKDADGNADMGWDATITVTVLVTDTPGRVTVSPTRPLVGRDLTATVADPDAPVSLSDLALGAVGRRGDVEPDYGRDHRALHPGGPRPGARAPGHGDVYRRRRHGQGGDECADPAGRPRGGRPTHEGSSGGGGSGGGGGAPAVRRTCTATARPRPPSCPWTRRRPARSVRLRTWIT